MILKFLWRAKTLFSAGSFTESAFLRYSTMNPSWIYENILGIILVTFWFKSSFFSYPKYLVTSELQFTMIPIEALAVDTWITHIFSFGLYLILIPSLISFYANYFYLWSYRSRASFSFIFVHYL
jgi:hypothetical protein